MTETITKVQPEGDFNLLCEKCGRYTYCIRGHTYPDGLQRMICSECEKKIDFCADCKKTVTTLYDIGYEEDHWVCEACAIESRHIRHLDKREPSPDSR